MFLISILFPDFPTLMTNIVTNTMPKTVILAHFGFTNSYSSPETK